MDRAPLLPPLLTPLEDIEDAVTRTLYCRLQHGDHDWYTHRHADEPTITYCLRCRVQR